MSINSDGNIILEDNITCSIEEFFSYRTDETWDDGYKVLDSETLNLNLENINLDRPSYLEPYKDIYPYQLLHDSLADMKDYGLTKKQREANIIPIRTEPKYSRNEKCFCGSGKKYKQRCMK